MSSPSNVSDGYCPCNISDYMTAEITMSTFQSTFLLVTSAAVVVFYVNQREFTAFQRQLDIVASAVTFVMASGQIIGSSISLADLLDNIPKDSKEFGCVKSDLTYDTQGWLIGTLSMQCSMFVSPIIHFADQLRRLLQHSSGGSGHFKIALVVLLLYAATCLATMIWSDIQAASLADTCGELYTISMTWEISLITMGATAIVTSVIIYLMFKCH